MIDKNAEPLQPVAILGGGPVGLTLALLLAKSRVPSVLFDARSVEQASAERRLLALSLGSVQTLTAIAPLPPEAMASIRTVTVSSAGQFGRVVIRESDVDTEMLGATIRYGDLVKALSAAAAANELMSVRRPQKITAVRQSPAGVSVEFESSPAFSAPLALSAEGLGMRAAGPARWAALVAEIDVKGGAPDSAHERFTRDGRLLCCRSRFAALAQCSRWPWCGA